MFLFLFFLKKLPKWKGYSASCGQCFPQSLYVDVIEQVLRFHWNLLEESKMIEKLIYRSFQRGLMRL